MLPEMSGQAGFTEFVAESQATARFLHPQAGESHWISQRLKHNIDELTDDEEFQRWLESRRDLKADTTR